MPEPVGPVASSEPCVARSPVEAVHVELGHAELVEVEVHAALVEDAHHDGLALDGRQRGDADVDVGRRR